MREDLSTLAARIRGAGRLTILTGAGVSAASGVSTFRGPDGLWRRHRPEDLATPDAFERDPHLVWEWYAWRRELIAACRPNAGHHVIAAWSQNERCRVVTTSTICTCRLAPAGWCGCTGRSGSFRAGGDVTPV